MNKFRTTMIGVAAIAGLQLASGSALAAVVITFDQAGVLEDRAGSLSYDGDGGALIGSGISFSSISISDGSRPTLDCNNCVLDFTTGANNTEPGNSWIFDGGGTFEITGTAADGGGTTIAGDPTPLLSGTFTDVFSGPTVNRTGQSSLSFSGNGSDAKDPRLLTYFGIDPNADFSFTTTAISAAQTTFDDNGGFGPTDGANNVTNADLDNTQVAAVPEPKELGIFGLGLALLVGSLLYRRKNGSDIG